MRRVRSHAGTMFHHHRFSGNKLELLTLKITGLNIQINFHALSFGRLLPAETFNICIQPGL